VPQVKFVVAPVDESYKVSKGKSTIASVDYPQHIDMPFSICIHIHAVLTLLVPEGYSAVAPVDL